MQALAISALVILMMLSIGLRTSPRDFAEVRLAPFVLALFLNIVVVPLLALMALSWAGLAAPAEIGLMLCAASPGGASGALFAVRAKGQLAASVSAVITLTLLSAFTVPPTITWILGLSASVDTHELLFPMMRTLLLFQVLPLLVGMSLKRWRGAWAERLAAPMNKLANLMLLLVVVGLLLSTGGLLFQLGVGGLLLSVVLVLLNLGVGALVSPRGPERRSYSIITGVRNLSLALLLSATYFPAPLTDAAILTFGLFTMVIPFVVATVLGASADLGSGFGAASLVKTPPK